MVVGQGHLTVTVTITIQNQQPLHSWVAKLAKVLTFVGFVAVAGTFLMATAARAECRYIAVLVFADKAEQAVAVLLK